MPQKIELDRLTEKQLEAELLELEVQIVDARIRMREARAALNAFDQSNISQPAQAS